MNIRAFSSENAPFFFNSSSWHILQFYTFSRQLLIEIATFFALQIFEVLNSYGLPTKDLLKARL